MTLHRQYDDYTGVWMPTVCKTHLLLEGAICEVGFLWQEQNLTGVHSFMKFHTTCNQAVDKEPDL